MENQTDSQVLFDAGMAVGEPRYLKGEIPYVVLPEAAKLECLEHLLPAPLRRRGCVELDEVQSFIRYVSDYQTPRTVIFARMTPPPVAGATFVAVFDYHAAAATENPVVRGAGNEAGWAQDRASYNCPVTVEWKRWSERSGRQMAQREFAEFLEESMLDVVTPSGAEVLEIVKTLMAKQTVDFTSSVKLDNGNVQLVYQENTEAKAGEKGNLQVPQEFCIGVPVFQNGPRYAVTAKLRYRIEGGKLAFKFDMMNPHLVVKDAFDELVRAIREQARIEPFIGVGPKGKQ